MRNISIIIPTLNEEKYIDTTLQSIKNQILPGDEIIIVDSYSTDNTFVIAQKNKVKIYQIPRTGIGPAKTYGAMKATNEVIAFLDSDGIPNAKWLERIREHFNDENIDSVCGVDLYSSDFVIKEIIYNLYSTLVFITGIIYYKLTGYPWMPWNNCAIQKKIFIQKGGLKNVVCEDYDFSQRAKDINTVYDSKMIVVLSDRRFKQTGFLKTIWLWIKSDLAILRNKKIRESTSYEIIR